MRPNPIRRWSACVLAAAALLPLALHADENAPPLADVLNLEATVTTEVVPDLAVVTLAIVREGPEVAPLTNEVNRVLAKAFADAKAVPGVVASNGGYSTSPRYDDRGNQGTRNGWTVRAQVVLKSRDFDALGALVGRLGQSLQIVGSGFELSPESRDREGNALIERGAKAFQDKAAATARAFGFPGYALRQVTVGTAGQSFMPRALMRSDVLAKAAAPAPLPVEAGPVTLSLTVSGSLQMHR